MRHTAADHPAAYPDSAPDPLQEDIACKAQVVAVAGVPLQLLSAATNTLTGLQLAAAQCSPIEQFPQCSSVSIWLWRFSSKQCGLRRRVVITAISCSTCSFLGYLLVVVRWWPIPCTHFHAFGSRPDGTSCDSKFKSFFAQCFCP